MSNQRNQFYPQHKPTFHVQPQTTPAKIPQFQPFSPQNNFKPMTPVSTPNMYNIEGNKNSFNVDQQCISFIT